MLTASRTAVLVCQGRAAASGRIAPGRFADPTALELLRAEEQAPVRWVRDDEVPADWTQRVDYETVRAHAEMMVPRTVAIDDAVRAHGGRQVVILGAGLDGRAWRMPELSGHPIFEVDQPASQADKRDRAKALRGTPPVYVPVEFGEDPLDRALAEAGHRPGRTTTWIWEGVVPYLTPVQVEATVAEIAASSAPGSRLVVNFQAPLGLTIRVNRWRGRLLSASTRRPSVWRAEPWRSFWTAAAMGRLLQRHGWGVTAETGLLGVAEALHTPVRHPRSLTNGRVLIADRP
jgi:methyltransferase (TIGR00027 family)